MSYLEMTWGVGGCVKQGLEKFHVFDIVDVDRLLQAHHQPLMLTRKVTETKRLAWQDTCDRTDLNYTVYYRYGEICFMFLPVCWAWQRGCYWSSCSYKSLYPSWNGRHSCAVAWINWPPPPDYWRKAAPLYTHLDTPLGERQEKNLVPYHSSYHQCLYNLFKKTNAASNTVV